MIGLWLAGLLLVGTAQAAAPSDDAQAIRQVMEGQQSAWNRGDVDC